jgi:hypothetical protein
MNILRADGQPEADGSGERRFPLRCVELLTMAEGGRSGLEAGNQ